jgi:hypothetical protein
MPWESDIGVKNGRIKWEGDGREFGKCCLMEDRGVLKIRTL